MIGSANISSSVEASIRLAFETQKLQLIEQLSALEQQVVNSISSPKCTLLTGPSPRQALGEDSPPVTHLSERVVSVEFGDRIEQAVFSNETEQVLSALEQRIVNSISSQTCTLLTGPSPRQALGEDSPPVTHLSERAASVKFRDEIEQVSFIDEAEQGLSALEQQVVNNSSLQTCTSLTGPSPRQALGEDSPPVTHLSEGVAPVEFSNETEQAVLEKPLHIAMAAILPRFSDRPAPKVSIFASSPQRQRREICFHTPNKDMRKSNLSVLSQESDMLPIKSRQSKAAGEVQFAKLEDSHGLLTKFHQGLKRRTEQHFIPETAKLPVKRVLDHPLTIKLITSIIVANAVIMAVESDFSIKRSITGWQSAQVAKSDTVVVEAAPVWFLRADWFFAVVLTVEVAARLFVHETDFVLGDEAVWNGFDTFSVIVAWVEIVGGEQEEAKGLRLLRIFRVVRVIRSFRIIRTLRFFAELRLLVLSLGHAAKPLMWCTLTLLIILFIFANMFLQITSLELQNHSPNDVSEDDWPQQLILRFSNFGDSIVSLLAFAFGSLSWLDSFHAFHEANVFGAYAILFYMLVIVLGVLNVISAVFVEGALSKAKSDRDLIVLQEQSTRKYMAKRLIDSFKDIDKDGSGHLTLEEWQSFINTSDGERFLVLFDVDRNNAEELYELVDVDGDGAVMIDEFVMGILQVSGASSKTDALLSLKQTQTTLLNIKKLITKSRTDLRALLSSELKKILQLVAIDRDTI